MNEESLGGEGGGVRENGVRDDGCGRRGEGGGVREVGE